MIKVGNKMMRIKIVPRLMSMYIDSKPTASKLVLIGSYGVILPYSSIRLSIGMRSKLAIIMI